MTVNGRAGSRRTAAFLLLQTLMIATVVAAPSVARAEDPSSVAVVTIVPRQAANQTGSAVTVDVSVVDGSGNPWNGSVGWHTKFYNQPSANTAGGNLYVSNGSASFSYVGSNVGEDVITAGTGLAGSNEAVAAVTWYSSSEATQSQPYVKFTSGLSGTSSVGTYASFNVRVTDQYGTPWNGSLGWSTCFYGQPSANCTGGTINVSSGNGSFGYTGQKAGEDTITFGRSLSTGEGIATHVWAPLLPATPADQIEVWNANLFRLAGDWLGLIDRIALSPYLPDIILIQEVCNCDGNGDGQNDFVQFKNAVERRLGTSYGAAHAATSSEGAGVSTFAVMWRTQKFTQVAKTGDWRVKVGSTCATNEKRLIGVDLLDRVRNEHVIASSVHFPKGSENCLATNLGLADSTLENLQANRHVTLIGGDFNEAPDTSGETVLEGLEADPDCWYRKMSGAHGETVPCSRPSWGNYLDTVWASPNAGGLTNPTSPLFCSQYTYSNDVILESGESTSCTNLDGNERLDKSRIDYVWARWERSGVTSISSSYVTFASADLGLSPDTSPQAYSDHRAIETRVTYGPATSPITSSE